MLLRNYYANLVGMSIPSGNITDVSSELSPRYARDMANVYFYMANPTTQSLQYLSTGNMRFVYGNLSSAYSTPSGYQNLPMPFIAFGKGTNEPTFNDYSVSTDYSSPVFIVNVFKNINTTYNENTKTYTTIANWTFTNKSTNNLEINEICLGVSNPHQSSTYRHMIYTRDLLTESFTLEAGESANFELTIKYTIPEPLQ